MERPRCSTTHDIIVFDVDGVLVDTSRSYFEVIVQALDWAWTSLINGVVDCEGFSERHFATTKTHPAFNDDYDIAWAIINCAATAQNPSLAQSLPAPEEWRLLLDGCKESDVPSWIRSTFGEQIPRDTVRRECEELYFGVTTNEKHTALLSPRKGLWENERPMITIPWSAIPVPAGIYTGRTAKELELALKRLHWEDFPDSMIITSDSGVTKPSPRGLEILCHTSHASTPLFLGDTESDRQTVHAFGRGTFSDIGNFLSDAEFAFPCPEDALEYFGFLSPSNSSVNL